MRTRRTERKPNRRDEYANFHENETFKKLRGKGWDIGKRGWPDFVGTDEEGHTVAIEVKPSIGFPIKREQYKVLKLLSEAGIKVFISDGITIEPFDPKKHEQSYRTKQKLGETIEGY